MQQNRWLYWDTEEAPTILWIYKYYHQDINIKIEIYINSTSIGRKRFRPIHHFSTLQFKLSDNWGGRTAKPI